MARTTLLALTLLLFASLKRVNSEDCPCDWDASTQFWDCMKPDITAVPTQCWPLHENVYRIAFNSSIPKVNTGDFDHANLEGLYSLELQFAKQIDRDALTKLKKLHYLDLRGGGLNELPDLDPLAELRTLSAGENLLPVAPTFAHMPKLEMIDLHHNIIEFVPNDFLSESSKLKGLTLIFNTFMELNATSIINVPNGSSVVLDELKRIWATPEEKEILLAKDFYCNIDIESVITVIDDPTSP